MRRAAGATPYRAVWRWHFYAGLLVAPVLLVLALTGALYLFSTEIERAWYGELMNVAPGGRVAGAAEQEAAALAAHPGARVRSVEWPHDAAHASSWSLRTPEGRTLSVFVDPYRAVVTGSVDNATRLMHVVSDLHGELLIGRTGDLLVELAASWTLVMIASGLYLWWPRRWKWRGVLVPRLGAGGRRLWRDLHAVPAALNALLVAFLVLSGLPWSGFWGEQLARLGTLSASAAPTPNFHAPPPRSGSATAEADHDHHPDEAARELPWAVRQAAPPQGQGAGAIGIGELMALAHERGLDAAGPRLRVFYPDGPDGVYTLSLVPATAQAQRTLYVDPGDGRVLQDIGWADYSPLGRAVEWGVMVHLGKQFGLANQLAGLAVCALLVLTLASGLWLWWRRRPAGGLGAPHVPAGERLPRGLKLLLLTLGLLFPLMGATLLLAAAIDRLSRRASPAVS